MDTQKNYGISITRFIAMITIIICHILQSRSNNLCFYFNIGVSIFLFISGYIYGSRKINNVTHFYRNRAMRILIPYYLMIIIIIIVNIIQGNSLKIQDILSSLLCLQWYGYTVPNAGHLWYISCIIFCYLITPLLQQINIESKNTPLYKKCAFLAIIIVVLQLTYYLGGMKQATASIVPYLLGYFISANLTNIYSLPHWNRKILFPCLVFLLILYGAIYLFEALGYFRMPSLLFSYYKIIVSSCLCMYFIEHNWSIPHLKRLLDYSDKYSYCIYLGHHIFILGSLSLMKLTPNLFINISVTMFAILILSIMLYQLSDKLTALIINRKNI